MVERFYNTKCGYNFLDSANRIFNCNETAMEFDAISKFVCIERAKNLFLVNAMEFMRKVQYFLASVLVELVYPTCLFTNPCLVKFHNMLPMVLRNPQGSKAKNLGGYRKTYTSHGLRSSF